MMDPLAHLTFLQGRRSVRAFRKEPVPKAVLERLLEAAITAPSSTNRQPWRFAVVTSPSLKARLVEAVRLRVEGVQALIRQGHHAEDFGAYGDFFFEPLQGAAAILVPQFRAYPDLVADFIASAGGDPADHPTAAAMEHERCSAAAAVMALLLQARAEGLGACWMAGPMLARPEVEALLGIRDPWRMLGAVALGWPADTPEPKPRKGLGKVVQWFEEAP